MSTWIKLPAIHMHTVSAKEISSVMFASFAGEDEAV